MKNQCKQMSKLLRRALISLWQCAPSNAPDGSIVYLWSQKEISSDRSTSCRRVDQFLAVNGPDAYLASWRDSGKLDWRLLPLSERREMLDCASRGGWYGAQECATALAANLDCVKESSSVNLDGFLNERKIAEG